MSDFKAKYQALQILQRLASGEKLPGKERNPTLSPRKPGIRNSDDILKEKYNELAELVALQHLEKQAVSSLQKMYVSPPKGERRSRRRRKDGETRRKRKEDGEREESKKQRPMSASSTSSYSSSASFASRASTMSNSSRSSSMSNSSRASSRSNVSRSSASSSSSRASTMSNSSRSSTRSKSSSTPKPVERHFVTIVEEEEEEEVVNQDDIKERQVVQFDQELAQENEEEANRKKEASKRRRQVSFVLETQEKSSDDEDDMDEEEENVLDEDERFVPGEESSPPTKVHGNERRRDSAGDPTPRYIEIEDSILREILSPRSPRRGFKLSQRSEERSPTRDRSKSPKRKARSPSPKRAWEVPNTLPLPPRPVKDIKPCDHKLSNTDNPDIKKWLRHKNALIRRERKVELQKEREKQRTAEASSQKRVERLVESEEFYDTWVKQKKKDLRRQHRDERRLAKEEKRRLEEERARREKLFQEKILQEKIRMSVASFGERVPTPRKEKHTRKKSWKSSGEDKSPRTKQNIGKEKKSETTGPQTFPSANPFKGVTYDEWMRQKMKQDEVNKKKERQKKKSDPELENIIPQIAKERIERAKSGKGKRVSSGLGKEKDERPECDHASTEKTDVPKPYRWSKDDTSTSDKHSKQSSAHSRGGLHRPSTAKNHIRNVPQQQRASSGNPDKVHGSRVFSPSFARPEPQGSESNDDHSEHNGNMGKPILQRNTGGKNDKVPRQNREGRVWEKALVEVNPAHPVADPEDLSIFLTEFDG